MAKKPYTFLDFSGGPGPVLPPLDQPIESTKNVTAMVYKCVVWRKTLEEVAAVFLNDNVSL